GIAISYGSQCSNQSSQVDTTTERGSTLRAAGDLTLNRNGVRFTYGPGTGSGSRTKGTLLSSSMIFRSRAREAPDSQRFKRL
ncbi:MAG: hypothetical protein ACTS5I_13410, partial [Rhodanobacter sp.]